MDAPATLFIGFRGDPVLQHVASVAHRRDHRFDYLDLERCLRAGRVSVRADASASDVAVDGEHYDLQSYRGIYARLTLIPRESVGARQWIRVLGRFAALQSALSTSQAVVINRPFAGWENSSKPLQTYLLSVAGFLVPASLSTSIPDDYHRFASGAPVIFKSNSGIRSIVTTVEAEDLRERLQYLRNSPVLFQRQIRGRDVRIHYVAGALHAVSIRSDAIDYRYVRQQGTFAEMEPLDVLPEDIAERCRVFARSRGVELAGFDFKVTDDDEWYCLEMNPMPAFNGYDHALEGRIARALLQRLSGVPDGH